MKQSENLIRACVAGAGKSYCICEDALEELKENQNKKILIITYTNKGVETLIKEFRKQNNGILDSKICICTWYHFVLSELIKPYQSFYLGEINKIKTINFDNMYGKINFQNKGDKKRYIKNNDVIANQCSELALIINSESGGLSVKRLEEAYSHVFIDEIQDLAGYDLGILDLLLNSNIKCTFVGDNKQATFKTHNAKINKKNSGANIWNFFKQYESKELLKIEYNEYSRRFNKMICDFANKVFPSEIKMKTIMDEKTIHDGVYIIAREDFDKYFNFFKPTILRYDVSTNTENYVAYNFGQCKGMTFDRVAIFPNGPIIDFLVKDNQFTSPFKYYVAVTRARYSIVFVVPKIGKYKNFDECKIDINGFSLNTFKYNGK